MTLSGQLADLALAPIGPKAADYLRALTATNAAAAIGELGAAAALVDALPIDRESAPGAAYWHAARLHARTQDDFHPVGRVHVGAITLAATLALADAAGTRTLDCLAAGYEVMCAVAVVYAADAQRKGYRPSGVFGPLASAASAAVALDLGRDGVANAIGLAAARSGGTNQSWLSGTDEWLLEVGNAARAGVEAALLTRAGATASPEALEGAAGWAKAYFEDAGAGRLREALANARPRIEEVAVKPYPVSGIAQVATDLACQAHIIAGGRRPDGIVLHMAQAEAAYPGSGNVGPFRSRSDALMSVVFCVAAGLSDGIVPLRRLERAEALQDLVATIRLKSDPALPEGHARLEFVIDGERHRLAGQAATLLHPQWDALAAQAKTLARRSEAPANRVEAILHMLAEDRVDAGRLGALMGDGP